MPELSIIVPVYKVEKYLPKCIDSILAQTFTDFELILIDDGSPDRCGEICDEYAARDSRIRVIHQENQGVSAARNAGLDIASGTYLGFVDSDDWIEPEMYETMIAAAKEKGVDVVVCNRFLNDTLEPSSLTKSRFMDKKAMIEDLFTKPSQAKGSCSNKIFVTATITSFFPCDIAIWEDLYFLMCNYLDSINSFLLLPNAFYHYRINISSATHNSFPHYGKKFFRKQIFPPLYQYYPETSDFALCYFLDSSIQLIQHYRQTQGGTAIKKYFLILNVKLTILSWILKSLFYHILTPQNRHKFFVEGILFS